MRVLIVGAGEVGSSIAASLADSHEVVVVDRDGGRVESLQYDCDVLGVTGDGADLSVLGEADVAAADIAIAVTDSEETNLTVCATVKTASDAFTIARVERTNYRDTWQSNEGAFGVDFLVCTNVLTSQTIARIVGLPSAHDVSTFADGRVEMAAFNVSASSPIAGQTVAEADRFDELTFVAVVPTDTDAPEIASGETVIKAGARVVVVGTPSAVRAFAQTLCDEPTPSRAEDAVVIGGSKTGELTLGLLADRGVSSRIVEIDDARARELAANVPSATVLSHDGTDPEFLTREHVQDADVVVATLGSDERSLLAALLAKRVGADRAIAVVDQPRFVELFEAVGVDVAVNPREVTAEEITRFTRERRAENVAIIGSRGAEILEVEIDAESVFAGRTITDGVDELPAGVVVGAITRGDELVTPRGDTEVRVGDHLVVFVQADAIEDVTVRL
ncbi:Trk system potassium transporter TrkA [Halobacterium salinarum]|uniref:Trk system potassium transporter TrkA n=1 Tax=Halobacterium salinarum TaxID=2242 RepID=UPI0025539338|nr:Trk system potassium transporter TrkA [Halobacterium salinarum]MDL0122444.1 Trk system potassium transporter TrkA [Halobacterium salinarum]